MILVKQVRALSTPHCAQVGKCSARRKRSKAAVWCWLLLVPPPTLESDSVKPVVPAVHEDSVIVMLCVGCPCQVVKRVQCAVSTVGEVVTQHPLPLLMFSRLPHRRA